jgi:hypothetical protein
LDRSPLVLHRRFGPAWGIGGFLLPIFLARVGPEEDRRLRARVAAEVTTTFATSYAANLSMDDVLAPGVLAEISRLATGRKYLVLPNH